ncbi:hypothetical protein G9A89_004923 [Geosiphon pyriformis]|nr:hypothetical protein G9A89_004923 [Geosiphon pyriformis]
MQKAYNSVGWEHLKKSLVRIKMCSKFIRFFGSIHKNRTNYVITDFSLTDGYHVHDGLDQGEIFSPLLWHIFYDPLLCEVKHQGSVYGYRLNSHFVSKSGRIESQAGLSSFFAAGAFVNDTIWVGSSQSATQHILNVTGKFFHINDISINNDKTVAIPINSKVSNPFLSISGLPISIAKRGESHWYLGIFLSTEGFSKPSLAKANSDVHFFTNLVLRKAVSDKQFLYLVLLPEVFATECSLAWFLLACATNETLWFANNFPSDTIYYPSFYGLKSFLQCQSESKIASLISFTNSIGILGCMFSHRSHDLQVLCWQPIHPLISPTRICVSVSYNFLAGVVSILLDCKLSLGGSLASAFQFCSGVLMSVVLGESLFFRFLPSFRHYGVVFVDQLRNHHGNVFSWLTFKQWKRLDPCNPVPEWFEHSVKFLVASHSSPSVLVGIGPINICGSDDFVSVCDCLSQVDADSLSVYTDGSLKNLGMIGCKAGAAAFFENINLGLSISVQSSVSSPLAELQAIALALECVPVACSVCLFSDSQAALDACMSEVDLVYSDFHNRCWVKCRHIGNVICSKNLRVSWHKVKGHSGVSGNDRADNITDAVTLYNWFLTSRVDERFLLVNNGIVSGNFRHFVRDIFCAVCWAHWEVGSSSGFLPRNLHLDIDWPSFSRIWHSDSHMATGFTSRCYLSVLCLYCGEVEVSGHVFSCVIDDSARRWILESCMSSWKAISGFSLSSSNVLQLLLTCASDFLVSSALYKGFVFSGWFREAVSGLVLRFSGGVIKLLGIAEAFGVRFGFCKSCLFFSAIGDSISVNIDM